MATARKPSKKLPDYEKELAVRIANGLCYCGAPAKRGFCDEHNYERKSDLRKYLMLKSAKHRRVFLESKGDSTRYGMVGNIFIN